MRIDILKIRRLIFKYTVKENQLWFIHSISDNNKIFLGVISEPDQRSYYWLVDSDNKRAWQLTKEGVVMAGEGNIMKQLKPERNPEYYL